MDKTGGTKAGERKVKLLDIIIGVRTGDALDRVLGSNCVYQSALEQQEKAFSEMDRVALNREQSKAVNQAIVAVNHCGAVYGAAAYHLGLQDGIRLMDELGKIK